MPPVSSRTTSRSVPSIRSGAQRADVDERGAGAHGPQVRVQAEALAESQEPLLGPRRVRVGRVPLRAADGAQQHGVRLAAGLEHRRR